MSGIDDISIEGAIIDCDGTLLDSMGAWGHVGIDYIESLGKVPTPGLRAELQPLSLAQGADHLKAAYDLAESKASIMAGIDGLLEDFYQRHAQLKNGSREFLERLEEAGVAHCIVTATDRYLVEAAFSRLGIIDIAGRIFTCGEVGSGKDEHHIFDHALAWLGSSRRATVVIDDAHYVIATAKAAGFPTVAICDDSNVTQREDLACHADALYQDLAEAMEILR